MEFGFPAYRYRKSPVYKYKGINNWEIEKLKIPESYRGETPTGRFFKTGKNALPTGENIVVINFDSTDGEQKNMKELYTWFKENNVKEEEYRSFRVRTPNNGVHLYYTYPDDYEIKSGKVDFLSSADIKVSGTLVLLPGSETEKDESKEIGEYRIPEKSEQYIKPIPEKLLDRITKNKTATKVQESVTKNEDYKEKIKESTLEEMFKVHEVGDMWGTMSEEKEEELEWEEEQRKIDQLLTFDEIKLFWRRNYQKVNLKYITEEDNFITYSKEKGSWERIYPNEAMEIMLDIADNLMTQYLEMQDGYNSYSEHLNLLAEDSWLDSGIRVIKSRNRVSKHNLEEYKILNINP